MELSEVWPSDDGQVPIAGHSELQQRCSMYKDEIHRLKRKIERMAKEVQLQHALIYMMYGST